MARRGRPAPVEMGLALFAAPLRRERLPDSPAAGFGKTPVWSGRPLFRAGIRVVPLTVWLFYRFKIETGPLSCGFASAALCDTCFNTSTAI